MWDPATKDKDFIDMMHDFVSTGLNTNLTTEHFRTLAGKHMKPTMDLGGDHSME